MPHRPCAWPEAPTRQQQGGLWPRAVSPHGTHCPRLGSLHCGPAGDRRRHAPASFHVEQRQDSRWRTWPWSTAMTRPRERGRSGQSRALVERVEIRAPQKPRKGDEGVLVTRRRGLCYNVAIPREALCPPQSMADLGALHPAWVSHLHRLPKHISWLAGSCSRSKRKISPASISGHLPLEEKTTCFTVWHHFRSHHLFTMHHGLVPEFWWP